MEKTQKTSKHCFGVFIFLPGFIILTNYTTYGIIFLIKNHYSMTKTQLKPVPSVILFLDENLKTNEEAYNFWKKQIKENLTPDKKVSAVSFKYEKRIPRTLWQKIFLIYPKELAIFTTCFCIVKIESVPAVYYNDTAAPEDPAALWIYVCRKEQNRFNKKIPVDQLGIRILPTDDENGKPLIIVPSKNLLSIDLVQKDSK